MNGSELCGAKKADGSICRNVAGAGTGNMSGPCRYHGGSTAQSEKAAVRKAVVAAGTLHAAQHADVDPGDALQRAINLYAAMTDELQAIVSELDPAKLGEMTAAGATVINYKVRLYLDTIRNLQSAAVDALRAGVQERQTRISEEQGKLLALAIRQILAGLGLSSEQEARAPEVIRSVLTALPEQTPTSRPAEPGYANPPRTGLSGAYRPPTGPVRPSGPTRRGR